MYGIINTLKIKQKPILLILNRSWISLYLYTVIVNLEIRSVV